MINGTLFEYRAQFFFALNVVVVVVVIIVIAVVLWHCRSVFDAASALKL